MVNILCLQEQDMLLKKNTKLAIGLLFLFNLKLDLQAIDERLW